MHPHNNSFSTRCQQPPYTAELQNVLYLWYRNVFWYLNNRNDRLFFWPIKATTNYTNMLADISNNICWPTCWYGLQCISVVWTTCLEWKNVAQYFLNIIKYVIGHFTSHLSKTNMLARFVVFTNMFVQHLTILRWDDDEVELACDLHSKCFVYV